MVAASGPISLAEDYLKETLAACGTFQTLVEAEDATEAKASIYNDALPEPAAGDEYTKAELTGYHPYATIETDPDGGYDMIFDAVGAGGHDCRDAGRLIVRIARIVPDNTGIADAERGWKNTIGNILAELWGNAGAAGFLAITGVALIGLHRFHPDNEPGMGDAQGATIAVEWGSEG